MTNEEKLESILPESAWISTDKNGYVHIRGIKGDWLKEQFDEDRQGEEAE